MDVASSEYTTFWNRVAFSVINTRDKPKTQCKETSSGRRNKRKCTHSPMPFLYIFVASCAHLVPLDIKDKYWFLRSFISHNITPCQPRLLVPHLTVTCVIRRQTLPRIIQKMVLVKIEYALFVPLQTAYLRPRPILQGRNHLWCLDIRVSLNTRCEHSCWENLAEKKILTQRRLSPWLLTEGSQSQHESAKALIGNITHMSNASLVRFD